MLKEIKSAADFLTKLLRSHDLSEESLEGFNRTLQKVLFNHYQNHWFPENPFKGSGFRCIRINHKMDPLVEKACISLGIEKLHSLFPNELTLWIDPQEVSYRIGEDGSICVLYETATVPTQNQSLPVSHSAPVNDLSSLSCKEQMRSSSMNNVMNLHQLGHQFAAFVWS
jgi:protein Tob/BTG